MECKTTHEPKTRVFLRTLKVLLFDDQAFKDMMSLSAIYLVTAFFFVCILFQSMPTSSEEVLLFPNMYFFYVIKFALCLAIIVGFYKLLGGQTCIQSFISAASLTYTYAMIVSMVAIYASIILFEHVLKIFVISGVVKSFIPYYSSVLFGWCCENVAGIKHKWKAIAVGLFSITLLLAYILYIDPLLCSIGVMKLFGIHELFCGQ